MKAAAIHGLVMLLGILQGGCTSSHPTGAARDPCATAFVEVAPDRPACGVAITEDGSMLIGSHRLPPVVLWTVGPPDDAPGEGMDIVARSLVLSPPSPGGDYRLVRACIEENPSADCRFSRLLDVTHAALTPVDGGSRWLGWSPKGRYAAIFGGGLQIIDTKTGVTHRYPDRGEEDWFINEDSFAWIYEDSFVVTILRCQSCVVERYKFVLPTG
jgi:hypothetical protein